MVADEVREMMGGSAVRLGKSCDEMMPPVAQGPGHVWCQAWPSHALPSFILATWGGVSDYAHLPDEETEAHRGFVTHARPHNRDVAEPGIKPRSEVLTPVVREASWNVSGEGGRGARPVP